ncbi:hypothetical protein OROMI_014236 [Orobanche minor]
MGLGCVMWAWAVISFVFQSHLQVVVAIQASGSKKTYIVQIKQHLKPTTYNTHGEWYPELFQSLTSSTPDSIRHTYDASYHGFSAEMTQAEVESLLRSDHVLAVREEKIYNLHTTRTPQFLGLDQINLWDGHSLEELNKASQDVIIGVLDTGVSPESESFRDDGMPDQLPSRWGGKCEFPNDYDPDSRCNKKLIGARNFVKEFFSPRDDVGHGTHTASTAAGSVVKNASFGGLAKGNARGVAYKARLAVYKVCSKQGCRESDVLAGMDSAIHDRVDVMSLSLGNNNITSGYKYSDDPIAVAAFMAMEQGIFVSCSAGNDGPNEASVANVAPWLMTVGAGTIDREFPAFVITGNGTKFSGGSMYVGEGMRNRSADLVYGGGRDGAREDSFCSSDSSDHDYRMIGKVVICDQGWNTLAEKVAAVSGASGEGMILMISGRRVGEAIKEYVKSTERPTALLTFGKTEVNVKPSPVVASFSSRGPNRAKAQILKPDVIGPGVNILAAWKRPQSFYIDSGTSMSCPHISGLAALLKAAHPEWSPSAIKSALMTTAYTNDNTNSPLRDASRRSISTPWAHGAGYVDPTKAFSPGLVYDASTEDYIAFLCSINYTTAVIQSMTNRSNVECAGALRNPGDLNYPSLSVVFDTSGVVVNYTRELTNVEDAGSTYHATVEAPENVVVNVQPSELIFEKVGDKRRYNVTFTSQIKGVDYPPAYSFGYITWKNGKNVQVKSPIAVTWA